MIPEIIKLWEANKHKLSDYFANTKQKEYNSYDAILKKIIELVIIDEDGIPIFNSEQMTVIDDGDYQGTKIFVISKGGYQPGADDYITTHTYYGSCSGCDTLQGICGYDDEPPTEYQLSEYMTLSLHLVQKMKWIGEDGYIL